jgi:hypothetical protein
MVWLQPVHPIFKKIFLSIFAVDENEGEGEKAYRSLASGRGGKGVEGGTVMLALRSRMTHCLSAASLFVGSD